MTIAMIRTHTRLY